MNVYIVDIEAVDNRYTKQWKEHPPATATCACARRCSAWRSQKSNQRRRSSMPLRRRVRSPTPEEQMYTSPTNYSRLPTILRR